MQDVPKPVLKRLQETSAVAEPHPDAELLNAFAEQSLAGRERDRVMEHLARCGDCREIVTLALPATEAVTLPSVVTAARTGWLSWPVLRWGVVAAGILLVTSVGVLQYQQRHQQNAALVSSVMPGNDTPAPAVQTLPSSPQAALPLAAPAQGEMVKKADLPKKAIPSAQGALAADQSLPSANAIFPQPMLRARSAGAVGGISGGSGGAGSGQSSKAVEPRRDSPAFAPASEDTMPAATAKQNPSPAPSQRLAVPSSSEVVEVQAQAAQVTASEQSRTQDQLVANQKAQPLQNRSLTNFDVVGKAKDPVPAQASSSASAPAFAPPAIALQTSPALMLRASPRWTISSAGTLQRSFDAGKTWEDVNVASASPASRSQRQSFGGSITTGDEVKKSLKEKTQSNPNLVFRAVAAIGPEVWAGGSASALYHSVDTGAHWTQVLPSMAGAVLTGDITVIEFSDLQHGRIATSARELWITTDGGQTWYKQQ